MDGFMILFEIIQLRGSCIRRYCKSKKLFIVCFVIYIMKTIEMSRIKITSIAIIIGILYSFYFYFIVSSFIEVAQNHSGIPLIPGLLFFLPFIILIVLFFLFVNNIATVKKRIFDTLLFIIFQIIGFVGFIFIYLIAIGEYLPFVH